MRVASILLASIAIASIARASSPTVAVMPFRDLSAAPSSGIGEAIRETVTTDLKQLGGVRVVERGSLDKILDEQHLQGTRADLDPATAARVGRLLGATLIVAGAYQQSPPPGQAVRLTARFVRVETGEIVGTAKVDGSPREFLKLQDRITAALLRSAGLQDRAQKFAQRSRPPLKSLKAVDLYGQAVAASSDDEKRKLLLASVSEDKDFSYAAADLAALEQRLARYQARADAARDQAAKDARAAYEKEQDPTKRTQLALQMLQSSMSARRYRQLERDSRAVIAKPPPPPTQPGFLPADEYAWFYLVTAEGQLHEDDAVLRDGERFLAKYPTSMYFTAVKGAMERVINDRREAEEKRAELPKALADMASREKWDLCAVARTYQSHKAWAEARRLFRGCLDVGRSREQRKYVLESLIQIDVQLADFSSARADVEALEKEDAAEFRRMKSMYEMMIPTDG